MLGYLRKPIPMFGMNDPAQTLMQLENYIRDGRLEMSEVMATQFTDMFLKTKSRDAKEQIMLVRGLQILCDVLVTRNKYSLAVSASKTLLRERKKSPEGNDLIGLFYRDLQRSGKCHALANKQRKARSFFIKAFKKSNGCIACALEGITLMPNDSKLASLFMQALTNAGPVTKSGQTFIFQPDKLPAVNVVEAINALDLAIYQNNPAAEQLKKRYSNQIGAIERGEMAANQKLQNALDSLKPKHDYYEYS